MKNAAIIHCLVRGRSRSVCNQWLCVPETGARWTFDLEGVTCKKCLAHYYGKHRAGVLAKGRKLAQVDEEPPNATV